MGVERLDTTKWDFNQNGILCDMPALDLDF
jgi:hypothetical protein